MPNARRANSHDYSGGDMEQSAGVEKAAQRPPGPETCPSLCVERSHPGREHAEAEHGCYCWELCSMGPTCPGANAGLDRGCWRVLPRGAADA